MASLNKVMIIGRLTRDPELRYTPQGVQVCEMRIASSRAYRTPNGEKREDTVYVDVTTWRRQAEVAAQYLKKGREVFIEGHLTYDEWETSDGQKRSKIRVTAQRLQFLGGAPRGAAAPAGASTGAPVDADAPAPVPVEEPPEHMAEEEDPGF